MNAYTRPLVNAPWVVTPLRIFITALLAVGWLSVVPRSWAGDGPQAMAECLLALPLAVLLSPFAENIHFCIVLPALVGLSWFAFAQGLWHRFAAWALWSAAAIACIPRIEDFLYAGHVITFPGENDPLLGSLIVLLRSGTLLWIGLTTFIAGRQLLVNRTADTALRPVDVPPARAADMSYY